MILFKTKKKKELENAVYVKDIDKVVETLRKGVNPNFFVPNTSFTLLMHAVMRDETPVEILGLLLNAGADPNVGDYLHGVTPLMMCAKKGKLRIAEVLLKSGADPNIKDKIGSSALSRAEHNGDLEMIKMLKKYGAQ